ncbi:Carboxylic acid transporter [Coemansia sp. RSA 1813]|nr:Carboxylic acid transporter [Coemansia sp. RSA 1646]KAJ1773348.1 Carboxylic acid transporter [Coemansia sp. RSA 1843]KAJ2091566.1 Carboxylic acid transporter [Coemansia sp. RSA 986]KAJ2212050.1 Carboxylic acid transporter [Coemansia sp. RSA 487]KAJ2572234.1 Carboxylic acid transporter [Coemansia sp. RSA 1813]
MSKAHSINEEALVETSLGHSEDKKSEHQLSFDDNAQPTTSIRSVKQVVYDHLGEFFKKPDPRNKPGNPAKILRLTPHQAFTFSVAFLGWMVDAIDFFCVSLSTTELATAFGKEPSQVTSAITVTLMLRPIGALLFGIIADRFGRRIPLMVNLFLFTVIEVASGFSKNLPTFIGLRAVYGILMGGEWGLGNSLAMEVLPIKSRGIFSGILQEGYAVGNLVAAMLYYAIVPHLGWRALYWISIIPAVITIFLAYFLKESSVWQQTRQEQKNASKRFHTTFVDMLKKHWLRCIHAIILMAGMNFLSHGSQDLYPTFLKTQLGFTPKQATIGTVVGNLGAIVGGMFFGYISEYLGRRRTIAICTIIGACFIPLWIVPKQFGQLLAGAFFMQVFVQGAWGVIPVYLSEISPSQFRATFPGLAYQLGNLIAASASQIEATMGEKNPLPELRNGKKIPDYGRVQGILIGIIYACVFVLVILGKEEKGKSFAVESKQVDSCSSSINEPPPPTSNDTENAFK